MVSWEKPNFLPTDAISLGVFRLVLPFPPQTATPCSSGERAALRIPSNYSGYAATVPVISQHATKSLKPKRIRQPRNELSGSLLVNDDAGNFFSHFPHASSKPRRSFAAVKRQICNAGAIHTHRGLMDNLGIYGLLQPKRQLTPTFKTD